MTGFRAILLEGVFYQRDGVLYCASDKGEQPVWANIEPMLGTRIRIAAHHLPPNPPDPNRWGGGCCLWESVGYCPAGHHTAPMSLHNFSEEGVLRQEGAVWSLLDFRGHEHALDMVRWLNGHHARIAAATLLDVEQMRESLDSLSVDSLDTLGVKASDLLSLIEQMQRRSPK